VLHGQVTGLGVRMLKIRGQVLAAQAGAGEFRELIGRLGFGHGLDQSGGLLFQAVADIPASGGGGDNATLDDAGCHATTDTGWVSVIFRPSPQLSNAPAQSRSFTRALVALSRHRRITLALRNAGPEQHVVLV